MPRVMECATVNAVMVATRRRHPRTSRIMPATNSRWSTPPRMCSTPSTSRSQVLAAPGVNEIRVNMDVGALAAMHRDSSTLSSS